MISTDDKILKLISILGPLLMSFNQEQYVKRAFKQWLKEQYEIEQKIDEDAINSTSDLR